MCPAAEHASQVVGTSCFVRLPGAVGAAPSDFGPAPVAACAAKSRSSGLGSISAAAAERASCLQPRASEETESDSELRCRTSLSEKEMLDATLFSFIPYLRTSPAYLRPVSSHTCARPRRQGRPPLRRGAHLWAAALMAATLASTAGSKSVVGCGSLRSIHGWMGKAACTAAGVKGVSPVHALLSLTSSTTSLRSLSASFRVGSCGDGGSVGSSPCFRFLPCQQAGGGA